MTDREHMPDVEVCPTCCATRNWSRQPADEYEWPELDEQTGVVALLHLGHDRQSQGRALFATARPCCTRFGVCAARRLGLSSRDMVLPVVPMFHVNAWGMPYAGADDRRQAGASRGRSWTARACTS